MKFSIKCFCMVERLAWFGLKTSEEKVLLRKINRKTPKKGVFYLRSCYFPACNFIKRRLQQRCKLLKSIFFIEHLGEIASLFQCNFSWINRGNQRILNFWIAAVSHEGNRGNGISFCFWYFCLRGKDKSFFHFLFFQLNNFLFHLYFLI